MSGREIMKVIDLDFSENSSTINMRQNSCLPVPIHKAPDYTVQILKELGLSPKIFCYADPVSGTSTFEVESDMRDWSVTPVTSKNIEQIPPYFIEIVRHLLANQFPISGLALAKPKKVENPILAVGQEIQKSIITALNMVQFCAGLLFRTSKMISEGFTSSPNVTKPVAQIQPSDPVLLIKIHDKWIEIGRWV